VPFKINVPLDVYGLEKGNYTVDVNGVQGSFELQTDNVLE
jgi:inhibitor of cysteine peptidase